MKNEHFLRVSHNKRALAPQSHPRPCWPSANFGLVTMMIGTAGQSNNDDNYGDDDDDDCDDDDGTGQSND